MGGAQYRPECTLIPIMGTEQKGTHRYPPNLGTPLITVPLMTYRFLHVFVLIDIFLKGRSSPKLFHFSFCIGFLILKFSSFADSKQEGLKKDYDLG